MNSFKTNHQVPCRIHGEALSGNCELAVSASYALMGVLLLITGKAPDRSSTANLTPINWHKQLVQSDESPACLSAPLTDVDSETNPPYYRRPIALAAIR